MQKALHDGDQRLVGVWLYIAVLGKLSQRPGGCFAQLEVTVPEGSEACVDLTGMLPPEAPVSVDGAAETVGTLRARALPAGRHRVAV